MTRGANRTRRPVWTGRRARRAAAAAGAGLGALLAAGGAAARTEQPVPPPLPGAVTQLQGEIEAMVAGGLPVDHPKVEILQEEVAALEEGTTAGTTPEPGVVLRAGSEEYPADTPAEAEALADEVAPQQTGVSGAVECEPVPQQLSAAEVSGATCLSVPQPDGSSRYVAVRPEGAVHVVEFETGGHVTRLADEQFPAGRTPADTELVPDAAGDVELRAGGHEVGRLDVGP